RVVDADLGSERYHPPERPGADLHLLVRAALRLAGRPTAGQHQLAPADLQPDLRDVDPRQVGLHDHLRPAVLRRLVEDVDRRLEADAAHTAAETAIEDAAEELVHLPAHPFEVGEEVALAGTHT